MKYGKGVKNENDKWGHTACGLNRVNWFELVSAASIRF